MKRVAIVALVFASALLGVAAAQVVPPAPGSDRRPPSRIIYPEQQLPLRFSHARHLAIRGSTCASCHTRAASSDRVEDSLVPAEASCRPCHAIERSLAPAGGGPDRPGTPSRRCASCHPGWRVEDPQRVARVEVPPSRLRFSHRRHVQRGAACAQCHRGVERLELATRLELPRMEQCLQCHRPGGASDRCDLCHLTQPDGVLRTRFPEGRLNPPRWMQGLHHDADFWFTHRATAAADASRCAVCHRDDDCAACHDGRVRDRRMHPNDYLSQHRVDARLNANQCATCHRQATFCVACHTRLGMTSTSSTGARVSERVHPPPSVWVERPVTSRHHGVEARRSLPTCISCHSESDCASCHATRALGGAGFSPHAPGFVARCGSLLAANARPCGVCHADLAALRARCR